VVVAEMGRRVDGDGEVTDDETNGANVCGGWRIIINRISKQNGKMKNVKMSS
jgi:hypothetical protein